MDQTSIQGQLAKKQDIIYACLINYNQTCTHYQGMLIQLSIIVLVLVTLLYALLSLRARSQRTIQPQICVILGSGGHTTEMCELLRKFEFQRCSCVWVIIGGSDALSQAFFINYFGQINPSIMTKIRFLRAKRTNEVKQSKITSIITTLLATLHILSLIVRFLLGTSNLIANGPGICVPFFYGFWLLNKIKITGTRLIFVESWCRVTSLSLTGRLVSPICDRLLVHWPGQDGLKGSKYIGQII